jgi:hypothetical protein
LAFTRFQIVFNKLQQSLDFKLNFWNVILKSPQTFNYDEIDATSDRDDDDGLSNVARFPADGAAATESSDSYEIAHLKEINLQLYQHAVKRILQNGTKL